MSDRRSAEALAQEIVAEILRRPATGSRRLIAIAGPPASGKSTVAEKTVSQLRAAGVQAGLLPMDGFHLDNSVLDARGLRDRKGAPDTFDLAGFVAILERLLRGGEVIAPSFDRDRDVSVGSSLVLGPEIDTIVAEGNYLLLDAPGWRDLAEYWDLTVRLSVDEEELTRRLTARWAHHGRNDADARAWIAGNDLPNARRVAADALPADLTFEG